VFRLLEIPTVTEMNGQEEEFFYRRCASSSGVGKFAGSGGPGRWFWGTDDPSGGSLRDTASVWV